MPKRSMSRIVATGAALVVLAVLAAWLLTRREPDGIDGDVASPAVVAAAPGRSIPPGTAPEAPPRSQSPSPPQRIASLRERLAQSSLRGTTRDGEVRLDPSGMVHVDAALRRAFDWYLSLSGEFDADAIRDLLFADMLDAYGEPAAQQILLWFDRYVGLRAELAGTALSPDAATRLAQVIAARRRWFGAAAEAMFGDEHAEVAHTLQRQAILTDDTLDAAQRDARLDALEAARPPSAIQAERDATSALLVEEQSRQFEQLGLDAATRHAERAALWGEDAADRLAQLDRERRAWDTRIGSYVREREAIARDARLDAAARAEAFARLRERSFTPEERVRIEALEQIGALRPGG
jgi:lipase chaperone LimK